MQHTAQSTLLNVTIYKSIKHNLTNTLSYMFRNSCRPTDLPFQLNFRATYKEPIKATYKLNSRMTLFYLYYKINFRFGDMAWW